MASLEILDIKNVSAGYGGAPVISNINITIKEGEFFGLMGLNGAGKTTLIKTILGLRNLDEGKISVFGEDSSSQKAKKKFAYLPELFEPPWFLKGIEFIEFSLKLYGRKMSREEICAQAERLALDPKALNKRVQTYSKGMRQKLGIIATVFTDCPLLILDEPMSGLDPRARSLVKDMLAERKKEGQTIFFSSHILADMDEICDRVTLLHDKEIKFTGKPSALKKESGKKNLERAFLETIKAA